MNTNYSEVFSSHFANKSQSDTNAKLTAKMSARLKNEKVIAMLAASKVDANDFRVALYTSRKTVGFVSYACEIDRDLCKNMHAVFRTLSNFLSARVDFITRNEIDACINHDVALKSDNANLIYMRDRIKSDAQTQYVIAAMQQLNILKNTANKQTFAINETYAFDVMLDALDIERRDDTEIESEMLEVEQVELEEILDSEALN